MKTVRCSGLRVTDKKRCLKRIYPGPTGIGWCDMHESQGVSNSNDDISCGICFDAVLSKNANFACGHFFHVDCVKSLRDTRCPVCRSPIKSSFLKSSDIRNIENRSIADKHEREGVFIDPEGDSHESMQVEYEFRIELTEPVTILSVYTSVVDNYIQSGENILARFVIGVIGSVTIVKEMASLEGSLDDIRDWLIDDALDLFPEEDEETIVNIITAFS